LSNKIRTLYKWTDGPSLHTHITTQNRRHTHNALLGDVPQVALNTPTRARTHKHTHTHKVASETQLQNLINKVDEWVNIITEGIGVY
jgi:hypothetical protein